MDGVFYALGATAFPCLCTALGAGAVFIMGGGESPRRRRCMDGFAGGVMMAASLFSLLLPALETAGTSGWLVAGLGVGGGALLVLGVDRFTREYLVWEPGHRGRVVLAIAIHNLPEGMVVGLSAVLAAKTGGELAGTAALALGIGLQNIPEGAAVSLPVRQSGVGRGKSFFWGVASGLVEPVGGVLAALLAGAVAGWMPLLLCGAAGTMIWVTARELIPSASSRADGTLAFLTGFVVMMMLDLALG